MEIFLATLGNEIANRASGKPVEVVFERHPRSHNGIEGRYQDLPVPPRSSLQPKRNEFRYTTRFESRTVTPGRGIWGFATRRPGGRLRTHEAQGANGEPIGFGLPSNVRYGARRASLSNPHGAGGFRLNGIVFRKGNQTSLPPHEAKIVHLFEHRFGDNVLVRSMEGKQVRRIPQPPRSAE
jgi:hypothetical protein